MSGPLEHALTYAALGWPVLPVWPMRDGRCACGAANCARPGKHPIAPLVRDGVKGSATSAPLIRRWFRRYPNANIGLHLGPARLVAVDVDPRNGGRADALPQPVPATLTADTGGGGQHLIYRLPEGRSVRRGTLAAGIDLQHGEKYIVAAPSGHASGGAYRWRDWNPLTGEAPQIAEAPEWLLAEAEQGSNPHHSADSQELADSIDAQTLDDLRSALDALDATNYSTWIACAHHLQCLGDEGRAIWTEWSRRDPRFDEAESTGKWQSAAGATTGLQALFAAASAAGWRNPIADRPKVASADEFEDLGVAVEDAEQQAIRERNAQRGIGSVRELVRRAAAGLRIGGVRQFREMGARVRWLIRHVLPRGDLALIYGEPGSGKSALVIHILAALTADCPFFAERAKPARAAYVVLEGFTGALARFEAYSQRYGAEFPEDRLRIVDGALNLGSDAGADALIEVLRADGEFDLVVIDTLARATPGLDENSGKDMGAVLARLQRVHDATGATVLLVHHSGKDSSRGARGWSGLKAAVDCEIEVRREGEQRIAKVTKLKDGQGEGRGHVFTIASVPTGTADPETGELDTAAVLVEQGVAVSAPKPRRRLGGNQSRLLETLRMLDDAPVDREQLIRAVVATMPPPADGPDRRRQHARQTLKALLAGGTLIETEHGVEVAK